MMSSTSSYIDLTIDSSERSANYRSCDSYSLPPAGVPAIAGCPRRPMNGWPDVALNWTNG